MHLLEMIGISDAFADHHTTTATHASNGGITSMLPMLVAFALLFYFMLIRPQQKRQQEHATMLSNLSKGDSVLTTGGVWGTIAKIEDDTITLSIAEGVDIRVQKNAVTRPVVKEATTKQ